MLHHPPDILFVGGDILPHGCFGRDKAEAFLTNELVERFYSLKKKLASHYPKVYLILGNDDPRIHEPRIKQLGETYQIWDYINNQHVQYAGYDIYGYSFIPPSPFGLKDWEKYDVSRFVDPGCVHPAQGLRTIKPDYDPQYANIKTDLHNMAGKADLSRSVFLFHSPPYDTVLDRAALDDMRVDHVPLDVHVGSIAIRRFIYNKQPMITLHGHIHESASITGHWMTKMGNTYSLNASYHLKENLALITFELDKPDKAERMIL
mgnify:CR=1 FL=1